MDFKRIAFYKTKEALDQYRIPLLIGLRRLGKTTILKQLLDVEEKPIIITFDDFNLLRLSDEQMFAVLEDAVNNGYKTLLLDEVQARPSWDLMVKNLFDKYVANKKIKVAVTGSSSLILDKKDTGVTRTIKVLISTLDFQEYCSLTNTNASVENFEYFLGRGGFPEFLDKEYSFDEMLNQTLTTIVRDDISENYPKVDTLNLIRFIYEIAKHTNGEINVSKIALSSLITRVQVNLYLDILEKSQILKRVYQVDEKGMYKLGRFKVFLNPHFHLWILNQEFKNIDSRFKGHIVEAYWLFASTQINGYYHRFNYLKTKAGNEIDFVILNPSGNPRFETLHEFKYSDATTSDWSKMILLMQSLNKIIWTKTINAEKNEYGIEYKSIIDYKNEYALKLKK